MHREIGTGTKQRGVKHWTYQPYLDARRRPPEGDAQSDFFVPLLYDVAYERYPMMPLPLDSNPQARRVTP